MKKKKSKKKTQNNKKKNYSEITAFSNVEKKTNTLITPKRSSSGIPKYVADRMARRIFFTAGIPTILGMSVFVVSYIIVTRNIAEIPPSSTIAISALFFLLGLAGLSFGILSASWDKEPGSFFGIENVPTTAITMGIRTIRKSKRIVLMAWGNNKSSIVQKAIEGIIDSNLPASFLQKHKNATFVLDQSASENLTRIKSPWRTGSSKWNDELKAKAVAWLCEKTGKSILNLTESDYNENNLSELLLHKSYYDINLDFYKRLHRAITGWPGGKPDSDDKVRPERSMPIKKRVLIFSPHPDDDVISMGGTFDRLVSQGHEVHVAYQTSGNIAVSNSDVLKFLEVINSTFPKCKCENDELIKLLKNNVDIINNSRVREIAGTIREKESLAATRFIGIPDDQVHFLKLPFYETGTVKKNPASEKDVNIISEIITKIKPHQIYAAGDLADPHGTHKVCLDILLDSLKKLKVKSFMNNCWVWLYRGAWHEWPIHEIDMAVPMSPNQVLRKRKAIFYHQTQKDNVMFQGDDNREFWVRAEDRNREIAKKFREIRMSDYSAIETFKRYHF
mgnify:CR=1 FL=1